MSGERPARLLVVWHSRSGGTDALARAVLAGATDRAIDGVEVVARDAFDATEDDVLDADAVILGTPERLGYMSGALKDFLERIYYPCLDRTRGLPYALFVKASTDGTGAIRSVQRVVTGLAWREVQPPLLVVGELDEERHDAAVELGGSVAAGLSLGLYGR